MRPAILNPPHGGRLCENVVDDRRGRELFRDAVHIPSFRLSPRQICDIELILNGGFSPLTGFLNRADYESVVGSMRLTNRLLWPMPVTLDISEADARRLEGKKKVALRGQTGLLLAILHVGDLWKPDKRMEAEGTYGTTDSDHPAVGYLMNQAGDYYLGGTVEGVQLPEHYDFLDLRQTPAQLRAYFREHRWERIAAFQTRNPMHRAHKELTDRAARRIGGQLLIHPVVGMTKPGDVDHYTRVRSYKRLLKYYPENAVKLSLLPLAMRMGGPREALWHALIRKNYGCTHLVVGRDHAGPGRDARGKSFYAPYEALELVTRCSQEAGIEVVPFRLLVYVPSARTYKPVDEVEPNEKVLRISGTELRRRLAAGEEIPDWFSYADVIGELRNTHPPRSGQGFAIFLTGLSGSGKSTIANALQARLLELTTRPVTLLDGDVVRTHLSRGLGFSKADRSANVQRIGFVASEIVKHRGIVICAPIAPYRSDRSVNRRRIRSSGGYIEVFVDAPLEVCERRDVKGLYAKARAGLLKGFTGIDDPYEKPVRSEVTCFTDRETIRESTEKVVRCLVEAGFLSRAQVGP